MTLFRFYDERTKNVTDTPPSAATVPSTPNPTATDVYLQLVQAVVGLASLLMVVPPIFSNAAVQQQIAGVLALLVSVIWAAYQRLVTKPAQIHAAAVASAAARAPRKLAA